MSAVIDDMVRTIMHDSDYLTRKLEHYNKWLLDPKRPLDDRYPGFPEDIVRTKAVAKLQAETIEKAAAKAEKPAKAKPAKAKKAPRTGGPTKLDKAIEIFGRGGDKAAVIAAIQHECGMSVAGATTYFYSAKKAAKA